MAAWFLSLWIIYFLCINKQWEERKRHPYNFNEQDPHWSTKGKTKGGLMATDQENIFVVMSLVGSPGKSSDFYIKKKTWCVEYIFSCHFIVFDPEFPVNEALNFMTDWYWQHRLCLGSFLEQRHCEQGQSVSLHVNWERLKTTDGSHITNKLQIFVGIQTTNWFPSSTINEGFWNSSCLPDESYLPEFKEPFRGIVRSA